MSGWRVARSLDVLRAEIDALAPGRSTASDGSIGDEDHAESSSDHNPNDAGVVCARDFTHDPARGADMHQIAKQIRRSKHPALKYIIWNRRIWERKRAWRGWRRYRGSNPHTRHLHASVGRGSDGNSTGPYDDTSSWGIATTQQEDDVLGLEQGDEGYRVQLLQYRLKAAGQDPGPADRIYGPMTAAAVVAMLAAQGSGITRGDRIIPAVANHLNNAVIDHRIRQACAP